MFVKLTLISPLLSLLLVTSKGEKEKNPKTFRCALLDFPKIERPYNSVFPTKALEGGEAEKNNQEGLLQKHKLKDLQYRPLKIKCHMYS